MTAQAEAYNVTATGAAYGGACTFRGFSIGSTAGADVVIYDGTSAAGTVLAQFTLAAKGWAAADISDGVRCASGVYVTATAAIQGHVRVG